MTKNKKKESVATATEKAAIAEEKAEVVHETGCCGGTCNIHTPKRVIAYRDERFMFGFVTGLAIAAMAGFILLMNAGIVGAQGDADQVTTKVSKTDWLYGNTKAQVTVIEFSDIDCPFCKRFHETMKEIVQESDGKVNWVYRHAPLDSLHPGARTKAHIAECIGAQGGNDTFWRALDGMMLGEEMTSPEEFTAFVEGLGVDMPTFESCMEDATYATKIQGQLDESQALGMKGTPFSVILAGKKLIPIPGALPKDKVEALIAPLLK